MRVLFTGDLFLGGDLKDLGASDIIPKSLLKSIDKVIINLESPLSDNNEFANKGVLYSNTSSVTKLVEWGVTAVNIGNNHIQDKGDSGIYETIEVLKSKGIGVFGAGRNLKEAEEPFFITKNLCILSYCQFNSPTLNNIQLATEERPGVNPLIFEKIINDLDKLPFQCKAIIYFHWGQEHLWLTAISNLNLAKSILRHYKVELILGMHPHRIQGKISENNKECYFSLGNFLFPNFYIGPPAKLIYPDVKPEQIDVTKQYHHVYEITYKKWRLINRISLGLVFDTNTKAVTVVPLIQDYNYPKVAVLSGVSKILVLYFFNILSLIYKCPAKLYNLLQVLNKKISVFFWITYNYLFFIKQNDFSFLIKKIKDKLL